MRWCVSWEKTVTMMQCMLCVPVCRREPSLPHDLHQRQVQSEHWTAGLLLRHLGPPGNDVRHAGAGEDAHTHAECLLHAALNAVITTETVISLWRSTSRRSCRSQTTRRASPCPMTSSRRWRKVRELRSEMQLFKIVYTSTKKLTSFLCLNGR